jgi:hypothetical protein
MDTLFSRTYLTTANTAIYSLQKIMSTAQRCCSPPLNSVYFAPFLTVKMNDNLITQSFVKGTGAIHSQFAPKVFLEKL